MKAKLDFGGQVVEVELRAMSEKPERNGNLQMSRVVMAFNCKYSVHLYSYDYECDQWAQGQHYLPYFLYKDFLGWIPDPIITVEDV